MGRAASKNGSSIRAVLPLLFERHAEQRMRERGIKQAEVEDAIRHPSATGPAKRSGARMYRKIGTQGTLVVIAEETGQFIRVVTTYRQ